MHNPDCLFCGYPRRNAEPCIHCAGTFPCCKKHREKAKEAEKKAAAWEVSWRAALEERNKVINRVSCGVATIICRDSTLYSPTIQMPKDILLGKRKGSHGAGMWSIPGGKVEPNEHLLKTARREVEEETGLLINPRPFIPMPYNNVIAGGQPWVTVYFFAQVLPDAKAAVLEPDKCEEWKWFYMDALPYPLFEPLIDLFEVIRRGV